MKLPSVAAFVDRGHHWTALETLATALTKFSKFAKLYMIQAQIHQGGVSQRRSTRVLTSRLGEADRKIIETRSILDKARLVNPANEILRDDTPRPRKSEKKEDEGLMKGGRKRERCGPARCMHINSKVLNVWSRAITTVTTASSRVKWVSINVANHLLSRLPRAPPAGQWPTSRRSQIHPPELNVQQNFNVCITNFEIYLIEKNLR
ncbi:hypothetical protein FIBSPDRAFT_965312 [Athelia psychrophila]|uniref:Uncharacterized protein n=1 Tax=Athelia psychrophila TaxID=1759441 RepID=A0A165WSQ0_9AGAM|nr:hypothetical protein FIBSPDRAFT_965312 [Fibularhizoctonia sp. CBS 109695]